MRPAGSQAFREALLARKEASEPRPEQFLAYEDLYEELGLSDEPARHLAAESVAHGEEFGELVPEINEEAIALQSMGWPEDAAGHMAIENVEERYEDLIPDPWS